MNAHSDRDVPRSCSSWRWMLACWSVLPNDVVVMCATREQAEAALTQLRVLLADLGLEPKAAKTRIMNLAGRSGI